QSHLYINARLLPSKEVMAEIRVLKDGEGIFKNNDLVAFKSEDGFIIGKPKQDDLVVVNSKCELPELEKITDLFSRNSELISFDFEALNTKNSASIPEHCTLIGATESIFIHPSAKVYASSFNTSDGPIYIGENAIVMEGSMVRGPFAMCDSSTLKLGTKIYGATSVGPHSKVGGEVSNSVILGYSNKGHDGFMGNSIIGEWCNLGADTNTSNLKNNYSNVRVWNYSSKTMEDTGLTFCGLIMGDHSKCSINTMFNTGTVVGVNSNIFGSGFPPKFVPSFSWGGGDSMATYDFNKAMETADKVCARRKIKLSDFQKNMLKKVFESSKVFRS
ncbi:MAG: putative sugar nucleotidyl transferase, partial [Flavobacteriales bacterium]